MRGLFACDGSNRLLCYRGLTRTLHRQARTFLAETEVCHADADYFLRAW